MIEISLLAAAVLVSYLLSLAITPAFAAVLRALHRRASNRSAAQARSSFAVSVGIQQQKPFSPMLLQSGSIAAIAATLIFYTATVSSPSAEHAISVNAING